MCKYCFQNEERKALYHDELTLGLRKVDSTSRLVQVGLNWYIFNEISIPGDVNTLGMLNSVFNGAAKIHYCPMCGRKLVDE